ncbi:MAG: hypothetical protein NC395_00225 [Prevotella sp.]|nr:hypothetical protein [Prevotella sp.]
MENTEMLEKLNLYTRREHTADEVFIFTVKLCDNEVDRDNERFTRQSLEAMAEKFVGVTGIFDHDPKGGNQTARLFMTEVVEEDRENSLGEKYAYLKGYAYMVRTSSNADLIREIDGGIKKEVSVSCTADRQICSVCGADRRVKACCHVKGRRYDGEKCFVSLEDISDVYEWSFVAVPAQVRAGVTKRFDGDIPEDGTPSPNGDMSPDENVPNEIPRGELETNIRRALARRCPDGCAKQVFDRVCGGLDDGELAELGKILSAGKAAKPPADMDGYTMKI